MDWTELRRTSRLDGDSERPSEARLAAMKAPLERRIAQAEREQPLSGAARARRLLPLRPGVVGFIAAGTAAALLAVVLVVAPAPGGASAEAAALLTRAAARAARAEPSGRWSVLSIRTRGIESISGRAEAAIRFESHMLLRVPNGDASATWIRKRWTDARAYAYGDRAEAATVLDDSTATEQHPMIETATNGVFVNDAATSEASAFGVRPTVFRALPRDPGQLLRALQDASEVNGAVSSDGVLSAAVQVLVSGAADAGLQAAVFEALKRQPGLGVVDAEAKDLDGRSGVAVGVVGHRDPGSVRSLLIIDPATGALLGERDYAPEQSDDVIPAGTEIAATAVRSGLAGDCCGSWRPTRGDVAFDYR